MPREVGPNEETRVGKEMLPLMDRQVREEH